MTTSTEGKGATVAAGKYLTFTLGAETYGIEILGVREIIAVQPITPLPRMPEAVQGVINLRGKIIPVIDLRSGLGLPLTEHTRATCIVVLDAEIDAEQGSAQIGCIVDAVREVSDIADEDLQDPPSLGRQVQADYIMALAKPEDTEGVVTLLDFSHVLRDIFSTSGLSVDALVGSGDELS